MIMNRVQKNKRDKMIAEIEAIEAGGLHGQLPVIWEKAKNAYVWDSSGNRFIDFTSTIFVANCGHTAVGAAVAKQSRKLIHSYTFPTDIRWSFLKTFKDFLPDYCEKIFLASAGSEVTSWAVNLMRAYKKKELIVHIDGAFHGKTGSVEKLNNEEVRLPFECNEVEDIISVMKHLEGIQGNVAGVLIESYQGWSGKFMNGSYIHSIVSWAKRNDIPVCFDEIQGGFWRTGKKFAYEWYDLGVSIGDNAPDLICMGKGLGGGLPISALAGRAKYFNVPGLSSTHSGNPLCCAAAKEALRIYNKLDKGILMSKNIIFQNRLEEMANHYKEIITGVNVHGLLGALIFKDTATATAVCEECMAQGLLVVKTGRESVKLGPPLTIEVKDLMQGLFTLEGVILKVRG